MISFPLASMNRMVGPSSVVGAEEQFVEDAKMVEDDLQTLKNVKEFCQREE